MALRRYTTPTHTLTLEGVEITGDIYVTYRQGNTTITFSGDDIDSRIDNGDTVIEVYMTQEQTGALSTEDKLEVQVNWVIDGDRYASTIEQVDVAQNLLDEVI